MKKGWMIVCDGSNGAGKTTVMKAIQDHLTSEGHDVVVTREPGGTLIGEKIREVILDPSTPEMGDITELLLFAAARAQHVTEMIKPALASGKIVLCDRFDSATKSFQHYARGLSLDLINTINDAALNGFLPDIYMILDIDPVLGLERVKQRGDGLDRMEKEAFEFLNRARNGYLDQARKNPERYRVIDASKPVDAVVTEAIAVIDDLIADVAIQFQ